MNILKTCLLFLSKGCEKGSLTIWESNQATKIDPSFRGFPSADHRKIFFLGVIDFLTFYGPFKKMESAWKNLFIGKSVSCQPPSIYADRFLDFVKREVFPQVSSEFTSEFHTPTSPLIDDLKLD